jgi:hypothetical protein
MYLVTLIGFILNSCFSKQQIVKKSLNKILSFLCAGKNSIKLYCMSLLNDVFNFVEIAEVYLPKEQYNASMLIPSLNLLGIVGKIQL